MIRRGEECRVGCRLHCLADEIVHACHVLFRFGRFGSPHVHGIVRGVDVQDANVRSIFEDVYSGSHQPIVDIWAIDNGRGAQFLDPIRRRVLSCEHNFSATQKQSCSLCFAGKQGGLYSFSGGALKQCGSEHEVGGFHVEFFAALFVEIGIGDDSVRFGPGAATDRSVVGVGYGRDHTLHLFVDSVALPLLEDGHLAFGEVTRIEAVEHDDHGSLVVGLLVLSQG